jgi:osmotically-inducible protein OsmY
MKKDSEIQKDVIQELTWSPNITHTNIGVAVASGIVTLSGTVPSYAEKMAAENAAQRVSGVRAMVESIDVKLPWDFQRTDEDIARMALEALKWDIQVPDNLVKLKVERGQITLSGEVEWEFQRIAAKDAVKNLTGVTKVMNNISLKARVSPAKVKEKIEQALTRAVEREAKRINVDVHGNKVILSGKVRSFADLRDARGAAFNAPGITEVENHLEIAS